MSDSMRQTTVEVHEIIRTDPYSNPRLGTGLSSPRKDKIPQGGMKDVTNFYYQKELLNYIAWIQTLGYLAITLAIAQITLACIHFSSHSLGLSIGLFVGGIAFLGGAILSILWSRRASQTHGSSHELFEQKNNDNLTRIVFVIGLLLAGATIFSLVNLFMQRQYSPDYVLAQTTTRSTWDNSYEGRAEEGVLGFFRANFLAQGFFSVFFFFYFLLVSRAAFRCLKFDNPAMSSLVFLGSVLLLTFSLGVIFFADQIFEYEEYPQIRAHFPIWNVKGLYYVAIAAAVASLYGFLVNHRNWRVGFFVLAFFLLIIIVFLVNFTGYAYRHTRQTYEYYKGVGDLNTCLPRLQMVDSLELERYGCPAKYQKLSEQECPVSLRASTWESATSNFEDAQRKSMARASKAPRESMPDASGVETSEPLDFGGHIREFGSETSEPLDFGSSMKENVARANRKAPVEDPSFFAKFSDGVHSIQSFVEASTVSVDCLNIRCCGLLGQAYTNPLLSLANFGLLAILGGFLVSIGCYYFWYISWVDTARDNNKDSIWLAIMALVTVIFFAILFTIDLPFPKERLADDGRHF